MALGLVARSVPTLRKTFAAQSGASDAANGGSALDIAAALATALAADR